MNFLLLSHSNITLHHQNVYNLYLMKPTINLLIYLDYPYPIYINLSQFMALNNHYLILAWAEYF